MHLVQYCLILTQIGLLVCQAATDFYAKQVKYNLGLLIMRLLKFNNAHRGAHPNPKSDLVWDIGIA